MVVQFLAQLKAQAWCSWRVLAFQYLQVSIVQLYVVK